MASPSPSSSPSPPPPPPPPPSQPPYENEPQSPKSTTPVNTTAITTTKKTQPLPWTHQETINLIQAYQEKWYSLKRGQLKASQWEEISITVAARCGYDEPSKTATQCRHKIEKLRKRYRAERGKPRPDYWQYFDLMDRMERGPLPISAARPVSMAQYQSNQPNSSSSDSDLDYNLNCDSKKNKSKSINHIVKGENSRVFRVSRTPAVRKRKDFFESDDDGDGDDEDEEEENKGREGTDMVTQLAVEIRAFAERFVKMENKKTEMMRDMERYRMEMENKKMEMILESQQKLVDAIHRAFGNSHKKVKIAQ